jgi:phosphatidylinositol alpha-1,6-mannosyltransferase
MEGFGLVTIEAGLRGTPVVAAALEGINDAVIDGETGFLLPPEDPDAWARRLGDLVTDREQLVVIGQRFRESAAEVFGEESMGQALVRLLVAPTGRRVT